MEPIARLIQLGAVALFVTANYPLDILIGLSILAGAEILCLQGEA